MASSQGRRQRKGGSTEPEGRGLLKAEGYSNPIIATSENKRCPLTAYVPLSPSAFAATQGSNRLLHKQKITQRTPKSIT